MRRTFALVGLAVFVALHVSIPAGKVTDSVYAQDSTVTPIVLGPTPTSTPPPTPTPAPSYLNPDGASYTHPLYGWTAVWQPDQWESSVDKEHETIVLADGDYTVVIQSVDDQSVNGLGDRSGIYGIQPTDPASCLDAVAEYDAMYGENGLTLQELSNGTAWAIVVNEDGKLVYVHCRVLIPEHVLLFAYAFGSPGSFSNVATSIQTIFASIQVPEAQRCLPQSYDAGDYAVVVASPALARVEPADDSSGVVEELPHGTGVHLIDFEYDFQLREYWWSIERLWGTGVMWVNESDLGLLRCEES